MPISSTPTHRPADVRLAEQILGIVNRIGPIWQAAVRDTTGGSAVRMKVLGLLSRSGPTRAGELAVVCGITPLERLSAEQRARLRAALTDLSDVLISTSKETRNVR